MDQFERKVLSTLINRFRMGRRMAYSGRGDDQLDFIAVRDKTCTWLVAGLIHLPRCIRQRPNEHNRRHMRRAALVAYGLSRRRMTDPYGLQLTREWHKSWRCAERAIDDSLHAEQWAKMLRQRPARPFTRGWIAMGLGVGAANLGHGVSSRVSVAEAMLCDHMERAVDAVHDLDAAAKKMRDAKQRLAAIGADRAVQADARRLLRDRSSIAGKASARNYDDWRKAKA